jgi:2-polyprenyl-6-methoxyphenol hydroxylase-like FAD-dependent oxidoreductase
MASSPARQHAVVIGGSIAGLLAARVLADHFARVTIVERDQLPADPVFRAGVPQGRHLHVLLERGQQLLEHYLPGFTKELIQHGGQEFDFIESVRLNAGYGWNPQFHGGIPFISATRPLVEWLVRQQVHAHPAITILVQHSAVDLTATPDRKRVTGVRVRLRDDQPDNPITELAADLVIDASGRHSSALEWLSALGYQAPTVTEIDPHLGYATRVYRPQPAPRTWRTLYQMMQPPKHLRGGVITTVEGGDWLVTLSGYGADIPPTDEAGFLAFARSLPTPDVADAIAEAEPLSPIYGYRDTSNQWRHYERLRALPDGFIVTGDAAVAFDPIYGQGMSIAAIDADVLARALARAHDPALGGFGPRFQRALARAVTPAWQLSTAGDVLVPGVTGGQPSLLVRVQNAYLGRIYRIMSKQKLARLTFTRVVMMTQPPTALFHPAIFLRAMAGG